MSQNPILQKDSFPPIFINLNGDYKMPRWGATPPQVGSVSGDLRLASLDAFIAGLENALASKSGVEGNQSLAGALTVLIANCKQGLPERSDLTLSITSKLNPASNELTYNFSVTCTSPKKLRAAYAERSR